MEQATPICRKHAKNQTGQALELVYFLLYTPGPVDCYGVRIRMRYRGVVESAQYRYVSGSCERMLRLIHALSEGTVTPTTLGEVLSELL